MFLGEIFQIQTQTINGCTNLSHKKLTQPDLGQNFLTRIHNYPKGKISVKSLLNKSCSAAQKTMGSSPQHIVKQQIELGGIEWVLMLLQPELILILDGSEWSKKGSRAQLNFKLWSKIVNECSG